MVVTAGNGKLIECFHCLSFEAENFSMCLCSVRNGSQIDVVEMWDTSKVFHGSCSLVALK